MFVCLCGPVSESTIRAVIRSGAHTPDAVGAACGAGVHCGKCRASIERMIDIETAPAGAPRAAEADGPWDREHGSAHG